MLSAGLDLTVDAHVHTGFSAGRDSVGVVVSAADQAGLTSVTFADQVGPDTTWLGAYADVSPVRNRFRAMRHGIGTGSVNSYERVWAMSQDGTEPTIDDVLGAYLTTQCEVALRIGKR